MSDDQGDAEFEASLAGLGENRTRTGAGGERDASRGGLDQLLDGQAQLDEQLTESLRRFGETVERQIQDLASRMGAGFREDLAQIRAIATTAADRDLTADVRVLRDDIAALADRDVTAELRDDVAAAHAAIARLASADAVAGVQADVVPLHAALDRIAQRLDDDTGRTKVLERFQAIESRLDAIASDDRGGEIVDRLDALAGRLDGVASSQQVGNLAGDLRAHLADALGGLDGDALVAEVAGLRAQLGVAEGTVVEQLQDHLADVASGQVVGALYDEVREVRAALDTVRASGPDDDRAATIDALRAEVEGIAAAIAERSEPTADPAVVAMRDELGVLTDEVRSLLASMEARDAATVATAMPADEPDDRIGPLVDELHGLRGELAEGLVVEPSDALSTSLDALRADVDGLRTALAQLDAARTATPADEPDESDQPGALDEAFAEELAAIRAGIAALQARLDDGLVLADDSERPGAPAPTSGVEDLADQMAGLRDLVASELDSLRQTVAAAGATDEPAGPVSADVYATLDPDTIDLLREEIRAAGGVADQVVDALGDELKALRRRLAVKAAEKVLDEEQLAQIADAVAARLGQE